MVIRITDSNQDLVDDYELAELAYTAESPEADAAKVPPPSDSVRMLSVNDKMKEKFII